MRKRHITYLTLALLVAAGMPALAGAAVVQTFSNRADFVAGTSGLTSLTYSLGASYNAPSYTVGSLTIQAPGSSIFGSGDFVSTETDSNALRLTFSAPVKALGLFGGVTDEFLNYVDGSLSVVVNGASAGSLVANGGTAGYFGFISDQAITSVVLTIASYDVNATSTAFTTLAQQADLAGTSAVPEPATWLMMMVGFAGIGASLRRSRKVLVKVA